MRVTNKRAADLLASVSAFRDEGSISARTIAELIEAFCADRAEMLKKLQRAYWRMNEGEHDQGLLDEICTFLAAAEKE